MIAGWQVVIVTGEGREVPHWTDTTRAKARQVAKGLAPLPRGVKVKIVKVAS